MTRGADGTDGDPLRVGVFGGTFDPPHRGHVSVARDVADSLKLDRVIWVVARRSPHKPDARVSPDPVRLEMVRLAAAADPRFQVSDAELSRPEPSYTVDTLRALRAELPPGVRLFLIIGIDQFQAFDAWHEPDEVRSLAELTVMDRRGEGVSREEPGVTRVPVGRVDISSTEIRRRVAEGRPVADLLPDGVARVIEREGLYRS